jgi:tetratricopeptide (TPR) repeat protein
MGALIFLASVLARYHRFQDAITVYDHLIDDHDLDAGTIFGLKLARAMAMLHEDRLFDSDRAIAELRRMDSSQRSGGLALLEIYRDVKTGHPREAIELFNERHSLIRDQLGIRLSDALALLARAQDLIGESTEAARYWEQATLLVPEPELVRRYPELATMVGRHAPASAPREAT